LTNDGDDEEDTGEEEGCCWVVAEAEPEEGGEAR